MTLNLIVNLSSRYSIVLFIWDFVCKVEMKNNCATFAYDSLLLLRVNLIFSVSVPSQFIIVTVNSFVTT